MTIDRKSGTIIWANPQASAQNIGLTVTDANGNSVQSSWSINVTSDSFIFVDAGAQDGGDGTISNPFNSIEDFLALDSSYVSDIVYFRDGIYDLPVWGGATSSGASSCSLDRDGGDAHIWLGYPNENVTIDFGGNKFIAANLTNPLAPYYFAHMRWYNAQEYGIRADSHLDYVVLYDMDCDTLHTTHTINENMGWYFTPYVGAGHYLMFLDSKFHDYTDTTGIGSFYEQDKMLIEGNQFYNQLVGELNGSFSAISPKTSVTRSTIRGNSIVVSYRNCFGSGWNSQFGEYSLTGTRSHGNEVCFNLFLKDSESDTASMINPGAESGSTYYYRNTWRGRINMRNINSTMYPGTTTCGNPLQVVPDAECGDNGPFVFENNVMQNQDAGVYYDYTSGPNPENYVPMMDNLTGSEGLIDSDGLLINRTYVGTYGHEIAESEYWNDGEADATPPNTPTGLSVS